MILNWLLNANQFQRKLGITLLILKILYENETLYENVHVPCLTGKTILFIFRMVRTYAKLHKSMENLEYFTTRSWEWMHGHLDAL